MIRPRVHFSAATEVDREEIYRIRHDVYGDELRQHPPNGAGRLRDALDDHNEYIVAKLGERVVAFVSITPPAAPPAARAYSIDKYVAREQLPFSFDGQLHEVRILTVTKASRGSELAGLLMYAALRWIESRGGTHIMAIGRREVLDLYLRVGLEPVGLAVSCGAVTFEVLHATVAALHEHVKTFAPLLDRLEPTVDWRLDCPFRRPAACFHGGASFDAIGPRLDRLDRHREVINADVLDAWFPPSPKVLDALREHLPWIVRTAPPTECEGLVQVIAEARGVPTACILPGAGSSDLIFRALRHWLTPDSRALILDPTYGEYVHVLEKVIGCTVQRFGLSADDGFVVDCDRLAAALADNHDIVVLVNPNSPTGRHIPRRDLQSVLRAASPRTRIWIDETYVDYAGVDQSLESCAAHSDNVIVCKSMSKAYALSGVRVAYLCAGAHHLEALRAITPPWVVSLPGQVAAVEALRDPQHYAECHAETALLRRRLAVGLRAIGLEPVDGVANFLLCAIAAEGLDAATLVVRCRQRGLFIRDASVMGTQIGARHVRIAVKDAATNERMVQIIADALCVSADKSCPNAEPNPEPDLEPQVEPVEERVMRTIDAPTP